MKKLRILFLAPHLSTGGMPSFLLKRIESLQKYSDCEIFVIEYQNVSMDFVVQRNAIIKLIGEDNFYSVSYNKGGLLSNVYSIEPDIIHIDEMSERLDDDIINLLYDNNRNYRIVETCHDISFNPSDKIYIPDGYAFCTPYHLETFKENEGIKEVIEFPIDNFSIPKDNKKLFKQALGFDLTKKHIINIGLWTPGKNQAEGIEMARKYPKIMFHFIGNQADNFKDYWQPLIQDLPFNVKVWGERSDINKFMQAADIFMFNSTWECNPIVLKEAIGYGLPIFAHNLPQYVGMYDDYINSIDTIFPKEYNIPINNTSENFAKNNINLYEKVINNMPQKNHKKSYNITQHFVGQPFLEITGIFKDDFRVEFWDGDKLVHNDTIKVNHWIKLNREYYTKWKTLVYKNDKLVYENTLDYTNRRVYIAFDSQSLGDTIAWIPYVEEFRKKHNCHVIVSTYKNFLFKDVYPELEFIEPGSIVNNIYGMYKLGWFYDENKEPVLPNTISLQQTASNILGLEHKEIRPDIRYNKLNVVKDYITIATNSTAGCKFWSRENWQEVINYLTNLGYDVINTSLEENPFDNCTILDDKSLLNTIDVIANSKFFIGLSSGLSWISWALDKEVIMISNFTNEEHEFKCHRPVVKTVCNSCWNNKNFKFDKGDYMWCPINKNTPEHFICQRSITPEMIINEIDQLI